MTGVAIQFPPPVFPVNSAKVMRACFLLEERGALAAFAGAAFEAYWRNGEDISTDAVLAAFCRTINVDPARVVPRLSDDSLKERLRSNVDELIARGGFGVPTFFLEGTDFYFGVDRLAMVRNAIQRAAGESDRAGVRDAACPPPDLCLECDEVEIDSSVARSRCGHSDVMVDDRRSSLRDEVV